MHASSSVQRVRGSKDLGSKNGTFVGGRQIAGEPVPLRIGVALAFGTVRATYGAPDAAIPTRTLVREVDP